MLAGYELEAVPTAGRTAAVTSWLATVLTATALPLLVALAKIGLDSGTMLPENAAALVGAGVLSVIVFPPIAISLHRPRADSSKLRQVTEPDRLPFVH